MNEHGLPSVICTTLQGINVVVTTYFWAIPSNFYPFQNKNKIIIARRLATSKKLAKKGFQM
jgi:hypothetical protein